MKYSNVEVCTLLLTTWMIIMFTGCQNGGNSTGEASIETEPSVVAASVAPPLEKSYPPVYDGSRLQEGDPMLEYESKAEKIIQKIYSDSPHRVFRMGAVMGDSVRFQLVEDWEFERNVWQADYVQNGGDFSHIQFPQIGQDDMVAEVQREYTFEAGELFLIREVIFARRPDDSEVIHRNVYVWEKGELKRWYRDPERYQISERFYGQSEHLFPEVNGQAFFSWLNTTFADPRPVVEGFVNLYGKGPDLNAAIDNWITEAMNSSSMITSGEKLAGDDYSEPVVWLTFAEGQREIGAAFTLDYGEEGTAISVYDGELMGLAVHDGTLCQTPGDVVVSIDYIRRSKMTHWLDDLTLEGTALNLEQLPNPLYFNTYKLENTFAENGQATWQWWLPGSQETITVQKTEAGIFWRAFEGAYH